LKIKAVAFGRPPASLQQESSGEGRDRLRSGWSNCAAGGGNHDQFAGYIRPATAVICL
jgi:hypothetical protein